MHLLNQKETNLRRLTKNWTLLLSLKQREFDKSLNESIELDKQIFIEKFNLSCSSHCFRLLRTLGFSKSLPSVMSYSGVPLSSSSEIANGFNTFFGSVFSPKIKYDVPASYEFLPELCIDNVTVSETEIRTLLLRCDDSSSMGADNIPSFVLRECATILSPAVQQLFYWVTKNCTWPSLWKVSYITPLPKTGPLNLVENYRPISILCKVSLLFERILFDFIYQKVRFLICKQQHGFMKLRSTVTQLTDYLDIVYKSPDISSPALSVYFDIRKAFDTVPHHLLLSKLQVLGFCPVFLLLFESYLSDRLQCVKVNEIFSSFCNVTSGVPQGSVIGPLLFLLFINDMPNVISHGSYFLYADDLKIFTCCESQRIQQDLNALQQWSVSNGLNFHPSKCEILSFNFDRSQVLKLGETELDYIDYIEDLGFTISSNLSWQRHIDTKLAKCKKIFYFIKRNVPFTISARRKLLLYQNLVLSILLYGCSVWQPSITYMRKLEKFQSRVFGWINSDRDYVSNLQRFSFLPVCYQKIESDIVLLWKMINKQAEVEGETPCSSFNTRSSTLGLFSVPKTQKFCSEDNFFVRATKCANELLKLMLLNSICRWAYFVLNYIFF